MTDIVLALGANLGDRAANLRAAVDALEKRGVAIFATSSIWETPPVPLDQPPFLNAAVRGETSLTPHELLTLAKAIEHDLGRRPGRRWGARPIDIDILFYGNEALATDELVIPHPRIAGRAFVLVPLGEVVEGPLPVLGRTADELLAPLDTEGITRIEALRPAG